MKLLILTQKIDKNDPVLGFFENWVRTFSEKFDGTTVICLEQGAHDLPASVKVLSLGKEEGRSKAKYLLRFFKHIFNERRGYDSVLVHMNQEYILLGGWFWKLLGKKIYMWRNHHAGSFLTDIAAAFCTNVFCTSRFSYTARYKKTVLMPVGIDAGKFKRSGIGGKRLEKSVLSLGRIAPSKKIEVLLEALKMLSDKGVDFKASIYGDPLPEHRPHHDSLISFVEKNGLEGKVVFYKGVPNDATVDIYNSHEIFVNLSSSGMYDKTIFEAMACETLVLASNDNLKGEMPASFLFREGNASDLALKLEAALGLSAEDKLRFGKSMREYVSMKHGLESLAEKLRATIS